MNINEIPFCRTCDEFFAVPRYRRATAKYCSRKCRLFNTPERQRTKKKEWRLKNLEKVRAQNRERVRRWMERHPEAAKESQRQRNKKHHTKNRKALNEGLRKRYWSDPEKWRAYAKEWSRLHPDKDRAKRLREKYATDPNYRLRCNAYARLRNARKKNAVTENLETFLKSLGAKSKHNCYWCGKVVPINELQIDHVKPLVKGGAHAVFNLVPCCASCNRHKQAQHPNRFIKKGQLVLVF